MFTRRVAQAGAVAFRTVGGRPEILLVQTKKRPAQWIFPKGHVKHGESANAAALRETREEAGVLGRIVRSLSPPLSFRSGDERVRVQYYLVVATGETKPHELRDKKWLDPDGALQKLTHDDAKQMLRGALPDILEEAALDRAARESSGTEGPGFRELLLAEYEHTADSLLRNEEDGERRVTFFMTLVGAAGTALGVVLGTNAQLGPGTIHPLVVCTLLVVFAVGHLTFARVVNRNLASDRYKRALNRIRRYFLDGPNDPRVSFLAYDPFNRQSRARTSWRSIGRGGWLETVAFVQSIVAAALSAMIVRTSTWWQDAVVGAAVGVATWVLLLWDANRRYGRKTV